jgi:hypothetical protein
MDCLENERQINGPAMDEQDLYQPLQTLLGTCSTCTAAPRLASGALLRVLEY